MLVKRRRQLIQGTLSPDGQWLLIPTRNKLDFKVLHIKDGFHRAYHPTTKIVFWTEASNPLWMPDNRHWIQLWGAEDKPRNLYAVIADSSSDRITQNVIGSPKATMACWDLMDSHLLGFIGPGRVLATSDLAGNRNARLTLPFYSFMTGTGAPQLKEFSISLPLGVSSYLRPVLSPDGKSLAWLFLTYNGDKFSGILLACCHADGTGMKIIGKMKRE